MKKLTFMEHYVLNRAGAITGTPSWNSSCGRDIAKEALDAYEFIQQYNQECQKEEEEK